MFDNKKQSRSSSLSNAHMVSAIAFVLVMGTGFISAQSFGLDYKGIGTLDAFNGFTQSAECGGLGNDCSEDNRVTNPPQPTQPGQEPDLGDCALCLDGSLTDLEISLLGQFIGFQSGASLETICLVLEGATAESLSTALQEEVINLSDAEVTILIDCLIEAGFTNLSA